MPVYYVETGANQRASKVVYDRDYSSMALAKPGDVDWDAAFADAGWFHITGHHPGHQRLRREPGARSRARRARKKASRFPAISITARICGNGASRPAR